MIRFFKVNDPYRLLVIFIFLLIVRTVFVLLDGPFVRLQQEQDVMGAFVNGGGLIIEDLMVTNAGPLYAYFYGLITYLSPESFYISAALSAVFIMVQAFVLNTILIRLAAFNENTYLPAIVYAVLMSATPEFMMLSPEMVAITFVLIGLNYLLTHLKYRGTEENILSTGFTFGLAALFAKPAFLYLLFILLIYLLYSSTLNRRYVLVGFGFLMPLILVWLFFLWNDKGADFMIAYFGQLIHIDSREIIPRVSLFALVAFPLFLTLISAAQNFTGVGMTNNQIHIQRTLLWLGIFGVVFYLISGNSSYSELIWLMPTATYFITMLLGAMEKKWLAELTLQVLLWGGLYMAIIPLVEESLSLLDLSGLKAISN